MFESTVTFAYGITVTTSSLMIAGGAWSAARGPFTFLDLLAHRKMHGTLVAMTGAVRSAVENIPFEVWDMIRRALVDVELPAAKVDYIDSLLCECYYNDGYTAESPPLPQQGSCLCEDDPEFSEDPTWEQHKAAQAALRTFGLALPIRIPFWLDMYGTDSMYLGERRKSAMLISLPPPSSSKCGALSLQATCDGQFGTNEHKIMDVSLDLPPRADERFRRLVSTLRLEPVRMTFGCLGHDRTPAAEAVGEQRRGSGAFEEISLDKLKPGWKIANSAVSPY